MGFHGGLVRSTECTTGLLLGVHRGYSVHVFVSIKCERGIRSGEGRPGTLGNLELEHGPFLRLGKKMWATRQGFPLDPGLRGATSVLLP